ncbi:RNA-binding S4 domain protein [Rippkaea orientalis PCC 8801]|uniref:RNA-binding S4 domain protein n=1 Tax=Rippkaea orientalis (strain PCC 8801 / RF-1) TaxID=41431 RepID=B7K4S6_RIPO1|nr:RNA-binding S4 domain-containing protein [Rippkaea orientalis]ACK66582.1 RNA-binding S4 domain protein [Rippkaea orientalis PCC 8801]
MTNQLLNDQQTTIKLAQFLKWKGLVRTGGEAKLRIQGGEVFVNGILETRRGRKLITGDQVTIDYETYEVQL